MSNSLQAFIEATGSNETSVMNALQNHGIISDNCVTASEVADSGKAVAWLNLHFPHNKPKHKTETRK